MRCDLHLHSDESDGLLPPREVVIEARRARLHLIALTDHDTMAGVDEARREAARVTGGPRLVVATEVTCAIADREIHVLGYFPVAPAPGFEDFLAEACAARNRRTLAGLATLRRRHRWRLTDDAVRAQARGEVLSRAHVADALVAAGVTADRKRAFQRFLGSEHGAFSPTSLPAQSAIRAIRDAGGVTVWAHPDRTALATHLDELVASGLEGLETTTRMGGHDPIAHAAARERALLVSGGSDWHGRGRPPSHGDWHVDGEAIRPLLERLGLFAGDPEPQRPRG